MPLEAAAFPILPGKTDAFKQFTRDLAGPRKAEHAASRKRLGVKLESVFLQQTPMGDMAVVVTDGDKSFAQTSQAIAMSKDPFDVWFLEKTKAIHGVDISQPPPGPPPEKVFDYRG
jgi:hypothetical protein